MFNLKIVLGNKYFEAKEEHNGIEYQADITTPEKEIQQELCNVRCQENKKSKK